MKSYPRANPSEGDGVTLSVDLYNRMVEDLERLDRISVSPPLTLNNTGGGINIGMRIPAAPTAEMALVLVIGTETGGGRYQGSILSGNSTGSTSNNFQLNATMTQSATDGPAPTLSSGSPVNNALVINTLEPYVGSCHLLWAGDPFYAWGKVMGKTTEPTPRTIVYLQSWPMHPVMAEITGTYNSPNAAGVYYGKLVQGQFTTGSIFGYSSQLKTISSSLLSSVETCWIANVWEQNTANAGLAANGGVHNLAVGTVVWGLITGYPIYAATSPGNQTWAMVYTWFPTQTPVLSIAALTTIQTAGSSYSATEQNMLNNLKTDVANVRGELTQLCTNLRNSGYSL